MVVIIGIDVHKDTHTAAAIDAVGAQIGRARTMPASAAGHLDLLRWAAQLSSTGQHAVAPAVAALSATAGEAALPSEQVVFAVEDCRHVSVRLERDLLAAGATVVRVAPRLSAAARAGVAQVGKSDPIDALAIARVALREGVDALPAAHLDEESAQVKVLLERREQLVRMRTAEINRLRWDLVVLAPDLERAVKDLTGVGAQARVAAHLGSIEVAVPAGVSAALWAVQVGIAVERLEHIAALSVKIKALEAALAPLVAAAAPALLGLPGCGVLSAARIIAEVAGVGRFRGEAALAMFAGIAPIPASSGRTQRVRLSRIGNRALNAAVHRISLTQARLVGPGREYLARRRAGGDSTAEARRAHKRVLIRVIFQLLKAGPSVQGQLAAVPQEGPQLLLPLAA